MESIEVFPPEYESIAGCLLGATIGDALGLPFEGLSPQKIKKRKAKLDSYSFLFTHVTQKKSGTK